MAQTAAARAAELNREQTNERGVLLGRRYDERPDFWARYGVRTGAELDQYIAWCRFVNTYRYRMDAHPRWSNWRQRSAAGWHQAELDIDG